MTSEKTPQPTSKPSGCSDAAAGCVFTIFIFILATIIVTTCGFGELEPGEANMCVDAVETSFERLDEITPDSLRITDELNGFNHYSSCKSFGNVIYVVNPVLEAELKSDTTQKYNFQYIARVNHLAPGEFEIQDFLVDSIWKVNNVEDELFNEPFFQSDSEN